ncbi:C-X-C motif chemokine 5-like [Sparus aurata]|uniref:C-X-C motif chemokine 5-like n=1 Tax=Sparus aurata TaxID=8175 RepID=A0A671YF90_SPAAU|nr:C-X-C motif chemokine 5-like [Sparus aurata]
MSPRILSIALLLLFVCSAYSDMRHPGSRLSHPCCASVTTLNITDKVIGNTYREKPAGPQSPCVHALLLKTNKGEVCVDPKSEWVKNLIANMRKE